MFFLELTMNPTQIQWNVSIKIISEKKAASLSIWNAVYLVFPFKHVVLKLGDDADACCLFPLGGGHCGQFVGVPWASFRMMGLVVLVVLVEHSASWSYAEPRGFSVNCPWFGMFQHQITSFTSFFLRWHIDLGKAKLGVQSAKQVVIACDIPVTSILDKLESQA